jgi:hypothetical protein
MNSPPVLLSLTAGIVRMTAAMKKIWTKTE